MKFKRKAIEVLSSNIFENDKLQRKESVSNLVELLKNISSPVVFSINAPWGAGKTTYLRMLHSSLEFESKKTIYFSAWETDFAADPLLAFLGEINLKVSSFIGGDTEKIKAWAKAKKAGSQILKRAIPVAIKIGTAGLVDTDELLGDETAKFAEALSGDAIEGYLINKSAIVEFKENIAKVVSGEDGVNEKLYIFVDELDRCRPTYAIELLERIKHLLDVEGLVFVLALDKIQLAHSVKAIYGSEFDAVGYLKRFIDIEFSLPPSDIEPYIDYLASDFELGKFFEVVLNRDAGRQFDDLLTAMKVIAVGQKMSLRTIEQLFSKVKLVLLSIPRNNYVYPELVVYLLFVKDNYLEDYLLFSRKDSNGDGLIKLMDSIILSDDNAAQYLKQDIHALIIACKMQEHSDWARDLLRTMSSVAASEKTPDDYSRYNSRVVDLVRHYTSMGRGVPLDRIISRVDMVGNFNFDR